MILRSSCRIKTILLWAKMTKGGVASVAFVVVLDLDEMDVLGGNIVLRSSHKKIIL